VNLSDLAAMGAEPLCFTLGVGLPPTPDNWLERFSAGLATVAEAHDCPLIGGDLIASAPERAVMTLCVQVHGQLPVDSVLRRSGAWPGDLVFVTGTLGDAAAGLKVLKGELMNEADALPTAIMSAHHTQLVEAFFCPESRVQAGIALRGLASAAIDISDGLVADLGHILNASGVGAVIQLQSLPLSGAFRAATAEPGQLALAVAGGDDYELCFTAPAGRRDEVEAALAALRVPVHCIGR